MNHMNKYLVIWTFIRNDNFVFLNEPIIARCLLTLWTLCLASDKTHKSFRCCFPWVNQSINQSINQSSIYSLKKKTLINKYNEIKLNKTNKALRNNVAYYLLWEKGLQKAEKPYLQALGVQGDCLDIQDRDLCNNSPLVEAVNHFYKVLHTKCLSSPKSTPMTCLDE